MPMISIQFRAANERDIEFLVTLRRTTMADVVTRHRAWCEEEQRERVLAHFESAQIILRDGCAIGLLKLVQEPDHLDLSQLQLLPEHQSRGIGTGIITTLQAEYGARMLPIRLHVYASNRALELYLRLGFRIISRDPHSCVMQWEPATGEPNHRVEVNRHQPPCLPDRPGDLMAPLHFNVPGQVAVTHPGRSADGK